MTTICIYHKGCADGFTAAWAVKQALDENVLFFAASYDDPPPDVSNMDVIMVDFSYKRDVIEAIWPTCRSMLILDHHKTAQEELAEYPAPDEATWADHLEVRHIVSEGNRPCVIFDMARSGAQIAWDFFHPGVPRPTLVDYVGDHDLWLHEMPRSKEVSAAIYSHHMTFEAWDELEKALKFRPLTVADEGTAILRAAMKNADVAVGSSGRLMVIGGASVFVANVPFFMASEVGNRLAKLGPFGATYFDQDGARVFSLRSTATGSDVAAIAATYGGGGHRNAAGFTAPVGWEGDIDPDDLGDDAELGATMARAANGDFIQMVNYTNWRGETAVRRITPRRLFIGSTEYHPQLQTLIEAFDHDRGADRIFALSGFRGDLPILP
jgi:oligoribonuclease NrnB/cAMP/cGMP phosphodiesterase (DHH superfamily)